MTDVVSDEDATASRYTRTRAGASVAVAPPPAAVLEQLGRLDDATPLPVCMLAAALCLAVALCHLQDQGGFLGNVTPLWMAIGYYAVEIGATLAIPFLIRQKTIGWLFAAMFSIGPFVAYVLSRSVGLPGDPGDVGNWGYTLGTVSLIVEGSLFLLAVNRLASAASPLLRRSAR